AARPYARWIDVFCERGAFDVDQSREILRAGAAAGLGMRIHANQLAAGQGIQLAVELGAASADHCTHLSDADVKALADADTAPTSRSFPRRASCTWPTGRAYPWSTPSCATESRYAHRDRRSCQSPPG